MKKITYLIFYLMGCLTTHLYNYWHERRIFEEAFEKGSAHSEVGKLIFSQMRFIHNEADSTGGIIYIDAALDLASHHLTEASKNLSKSTLTSAVASHLRAYKEQLRGLSVTYSDPEKTFLGDSRGRNLYIYRHRDLSCKFAVGATSDIVVDEILRQILNRLPEKMSNGAISE